VIPELTFVRDEKVAGCSHPGRGSQLLPTLAEMAAVHGVTAIVTLTEGALSPALVAEAGLRSLHVPVPDFGVPTFEEVASAVSFINEEIARGGCVVVHCATGYGRTGTMLACWLVADGCAAHEAIAEVRRLRPGSIETAQQEGFIRQWEAWWKGTRPENRGSQGES